jgi:ATP-dependent DNA helicase DinG
VPGRSLRLAVFDKVPWPKPTILHKARRARFGKTYDDLLTRLRLKQAFGRLIRGATDKGCFVILEGATPSRLLTAFPPDAPVKRCGLREAIGDIAAFLTETAANRTPLIEQTTPR